MLFPSESGIIPPTETDDVPLQCNAIDNNIIEGFESSTPSCSSGINHNEDKWVIITQVTDDKQEYKFEIRGFENPQEISTDTLIYFKSCAHSDC